MDQDKKKRKKGAVRDEYDDTASKPNSVAHKKQRIYTQEDAAFAKIYEDLAHEVSNVRRDATKLLLDKLSTHTSPDAEILAKVLRRLVRGLCSSRKAARSGFFLAFTEYLRLETLRLPEESADDELGPLVLRYVDEATTAEGKAPSQEKRDYALGRVLTYQAMIESKFVFEAKGSTALWTTMLRKMLSQVKTLPWLKEEYCSMINNCIPFLAKKGQMNGYIDDILSVLAEQKLEHTPEGVALWLTVSANGKEISYPEDCWANKDPLDKREKPRLVRILKRGAGDELPGADGDKKRYSGGNQTRLSFAWNVLIFSFINRLDYKLSNKDAKREKRFKSFWKEMVDDILFAESASPERKSLGLQLLGSVINGCPLWAIPSVFSSNVMRCIVNQRSDSERLLHEAAKIPLDKIKGRVRAQPEAARSFVEALISSSGTVNFDHLTRTKTINNIINGTHGQFLLDLLGSIDSAVLTPGIWKLEAADVESHRRMLADMLLTLTRGRSVDLKEEWPKHLLQILLKFSYFYWEPSPEIPISAATREIFRSRLMSCINHMISSESQASEVCSTIITSLEKMKDRKEYSVLLKSDEGVQETLQRAISTVVRMDHNKNSGDVGSTQSPVTNAFLCLYTMTILQVYNGEPDAVSMLEEIDTAYKATIDGNENVKEAFDLLIEVLLGMVSKQSALSRKLAEQVFTVVAPKLTPSALQSMLDVLAQRENSAGQNALFDQDGDDGSDGVIEGLDDSDVEEVDGAISAEEDGASNGSAQDSESGDAMSDATDNDNEEELQRLDASLGEILKTGRSTAEEEATDDESMDDDEMMALEPHLTKVFQERKKASSKKRDNKDAKEMMINFKNRILDLLTIYVKQEYSNVLALDLILPLLQLILESTSKQLAEKAFNLLKQYIELCGKKKEGLPHPEDLESVWTTLQTLLERVSRKNAKLYQNACSRSSLFLVKVVTHMEQSSKNENGRQALGRAQDMFSGLQKRWLMDPKLEIQFSFFQNWLGWCNDMRKAR
ncbi:hypothetical protein EV356DRAFT_462095 [Viridothelium virens]|uniref:DNA polymerase V n=1 Tax=Viridothelium virens TaxID=1048519 RepID=A0A6A6HGT0_VIRVR|nr:hypothetical protein EV356DRAFT_462095 [Viridothelium virens]